jgi:serine/threonine-protein kinase
LPAGYEVVREIGRGGMGAVYEAIQTKSGERVAIKVVVAGEEASKRSAQLFLREASVLSQLRHKRIVSFCECAMIGGRFFLVMEYVETIGVKQHLSDRPEDARIRYYCGIICQVLEALVYAHGRGLVHRDIKPSNILVSLAGGRLRAKLADFGLAKNFETAGFSSLTRDGELRGTLPFMPPEQVIDSRYAKPPADIYSAGATLYYYLAGRYPHDFAKSSSKFAVVLRRSPTPLLRVNPNLPEGLASIVEKALAHDPASRFPSAKEMHRALYPFAKRPE